MENYTDKTYSKNTWTSIYDDYSYGFGVEIGGEIFTNNTLKFASNYKKDLHKEHNIGDPWQEMIDETLSFALEDTHEFSENTSLIVGLSYDIRDAKKAQNYSDPKPVIDKRTRKQKTNKKGRLLWDENPYVWEFDKDKIKAFNYQALLKHSFDGNDELTLSFAKKSRFPTIKDRYSRRFDSTEPNPYLKE
ncbi:TonB-dependent receptor [Campylobacter corcagiensis]|uniref:TonB-dependent receptor n=1 Tax=Campylobacter corcagiensis TaxID=1448857 RepID=A0A7M1LHX8_9BACT|nr:TonB-dependent receptor [Campylobacter corcagiensis]QOQ87973.1 TonB-dependent receptor [Campylobacter corcagiensis]